MGEEAARSCSSPVDDPGLEPGQRLAHRARPDRLADQVGGHLAGLGLAVAVGGLEARSPRGRRRSSPGRAARRRRPSAAAPAAAAASVRRASIRYSVGAWQRTLTPSASAKSSRSAGSKRPSWMTAAAPVSQGARKTLRADFDQPVAVVHQARSPRARAEPVLGLDPLAEQVAVGVDHAARLAGGARGEDDQRRVLGVHRRRPRPASPAAGPRRGRRRSRPVHRRHPVGQHAEQRLFADAERRVRRPRPGAPGPCAQLRAAGQRHRAHPPAGEQREHPLDPVADQGHHHVAALAPRGRRTPPRAPPRWRSVRRSTSRAGSPPHQRQRSRASSR